MSAVEEYMRFKYRIDRKMWRLRPWVPVYTSGWRDELHLEASNNHYCNIRIPDKHVLLIADYMSFIVERKQWKRPTRSYHKAVLENYHRIKVV